MGKRKRNAGPAGARQGDLPARSDAAVLGPSSTRYAKATHSSPTETISASDAARTIAVRERTARPRIALGAAGGLRLAPFDPE